MLTKLLKYEFLSTGRIFLPLYLTLVGVSAILKLFITIERSIDLMIVPQVLFTLLYVVLIVAVFALVYIPVSYTHLDVYKRQHYNSL